MWKHFQTLFFVIAVQVSSIHTYAFKSIDSHAFNSTEMQVIVVFAVDLVCPSYQAKIAAVNNTSNNCEDFKTTMRDALADIKQSYTSKLMAAHNEYATGADATVTTAIEDREKIALHGIAHKFKVGEMLLTNFFHNPRTTELDFVQKNIGPVCDNAELQMRTTLALVEFHYSELTNRRQENSAKQFELMSMPDDMNAMIQSTVQEANRSGKSPDEMYTEGAACIYEKLDAQLDDYIAEVNNTIRAFETGLRTVVTTTLDAVITEDWNAVQMAERKFLEYQTPNNTTSTSTSPVDANIVGDDLVRQITDRVAEYYDSYLWELYTLAMDVFTSMAILEYDLKHSSEAHVVT